MRRLDIIQNQLTAIVEALKHILPDGTIVLTSENNVTSFDFRHVHETQDKVNGEAQGPEDPQSPEILNKRAEILRTAEELINGDRAQTYGAPEVSFGRIADIWNAMGIRRHVVQSPVNPETGATLPGKGPFYKAEKLDAIDAAHMLIGMKLSRTVGSHGAAVDDWIDLAGYAGLGGEMATPKIDVNNIHYNWMPYTAHYLCSLCFNEVAPFDVDLEKHTTEVHHLMEYRVDDGPLASQ